jgi:hypothetical protein
MGQLVAAGLAQAPTVGGTLLPLAGRARVYACGITPYIVERIFDAGQKRAATRRR